jgi:hypothetical protein
VYVPTTLKKRIPEYIEMAFRVLFHMGYLDFKKRTMKIPTWPQKKASNVPKTHREVEVNNP